MRERDAIRPPHKPWKRKKRENPAAICTRILGREFGGHVMYILMNAAYEGAARERRCHEASAAAAQKRWPLKGPRTSNARADQPLFAMRKSPASEWNETVRTAIALLFMICEQVKTRGKHAGWSGGKSLYLGQQRRKRDGEWQYVPKHEQLGLAARLNCDVRTLERAIAVMVTGGILKAWQPPAWDEHGQPLPEHMRGETYAYQLYQLAELPECLLYTLRRHDDAIAAKAKKQAAKSSPAPVARPARSSAAEFAADVAEALALSDEELGAVAFVRGLKPS